MKRIIRVLVLLITFTFMSINVFASNEDKISIMNDVEIDRPLKGDVVVIMGDIDTKYSVSGDVVAVIGDIHINADVNGDVVAVLGDVIIDPQVNINGDVVAIGGSGLTIAPDATIQGDTVNISFGNANVHRLGFIFNIFGRIGFLTLLLLGFVITALANQKVSNTLIDFEQNIGRRIIVGIIAPVLLVVAIPILLITIIGLPIVMILFFIAHLLGLAVVCTYIGRKIMELFNNKTTLYGEYVIGAILIAIIVNSIYSSGWIVAILSIFSLGIGLDAWLIKRYNKV